MKSGICYPSYSRPAAWVTGQGSDADFPVANVALLDEPRRIWRSASAGFIALSFKLTQARLIDFIAFVHHTAPVGASFYLKLSSTDDVEAADAFDGPEELFWPTGSVNGDYLAVRPYRIPAPVIAKSGVLYIYGAPGLELGGVEVGRFWEWNVEVPRAIGFDTRSTSSDVAGVDHITRQWSPRVVIGDRELVSQAEVDTKFLDFQADTGLSKAFVWCWDVDGPETWPREAMLVTNNALPAGSVPDYDAGRMSFSFREHLR